MKKICTVLTLLLIGFSSFSQTRWIAHLSHSGTLGFAKDKLNSLFGPGEVYPRDEFEFVNNNRSEFNVLTVRKDGVDLPLVEIHQDGKYMNFYNEHDSLIICKRSYNEYLRYGTLLYDNIKNQVVIYSRFHNDQFAVIRDSLSEWGTNKRIRFNEDYVYTKKYDRIFLNYPQLDTRYFDRVHDKVFEQSAEQAKPIEFQEVPKEQETEEIEQPLRKSKRKINKAYKGNETGVMLYPSNPSFDLKIDKMPTSGIVNISESPLPQFDFRHIDPQPEKSVDKIQTVHSGKMAIGLASSFLLFNFLIVYGSRTKK